MEELDALTAQHAELESLLAGLDDAAWSRPTPCEGWDVADVVVHLSQTDALAVASLRHEFDGVLGGADVDEAAAASVAMSRGGSPSEVLAAWRTNATSVRTLLDGADPRERVTWVAGTLSVRTLATTRLAECWIHSGDVAAAVGASLPPTERLRLIARLAWRTLPYAFELAGHELAGPVRFSLVGPADEPWVFGDDDAATVVTGSAADLCAVAGRRADPATTSLVATGPDAATVLSLVRTYA